MIFGRPALNWAKGLCNQRKAFSLSRIVLHIVEDSLSHEELPRLKHCTKIKNPKFKEESTRVEEIQPEWLTSVASVRNVDSQRLDYFLDLYNEAPAEPN